MAQLIVRNLEDDLVRELKIRAAGNGRPAEAEHREILRMALKPAAGRKSLKAMLLEMPAAGRDADFDRPRDRARRVRL